jgi:DnaA family protein
VNAPSQLPLGVHLRDSSVFASFHPGSNQPVVDTLLGLSGHAPPRVVWLYGAHGTGKTHLLQALCARATQRGEQSAWLPLDQFDSPEVLSGLGVLQWVCLDDAQRIAGNATWERQLFGLHQSLEEEGGRLVMGADVSPNALTWGLPDLASRLRGGLILRLQALDDAAQSAALQLRAELRGLQLSEEVAQYLLRRLPRDMGTLCEFLDRLDRAALVAQRRLTVPFVREVLEASGVHVS